MNPLNNDNVPPFPVIHPSLQQRDTTISTTTEAITQLGSQLMDNLNRRSTALANGAHFDLALRDAAVMRAICPTSSLGYLKAGDIYQQQGRQQKAVAMYDEGLRNTPASDHGYTNLQVQHASALSAANKQVDFISQLPLDLVESELLPLVWDNYKLDSDTPCPYLYVSHTWRRLILQCNNLNFEHEELGKSNTVYLRELEQFSEHVKTLSMEAGTTDVYKDSLAILNRCQFPNLTKLSIMYIGYEEYELTSALDSVGNTLTNLTLSTQERNTPGIHLAVVLGHCPNLVSLDLQVWGILDLTEEYPKLTHLAMNVMGDDLSQDTMTNICSYLPSLVFLELFPLPDLRFLTTVCGYCPEMKLLTCGVFNAFDQGGWHQQVQGLQKLCFGLDGDHEELHADHLIPLLLENRRSLDHIRLEGTIMDPNVSLHDDGLKFDRLETLDITADNDELATLALSIIQLSPHLQHVKLSNEAAKRDDIWNAVKELSNLQTLSAKEMTVDSISFRSLLEHKVQHGTGSSLTELHVDLDAQISMFSWIDVISGLNSLKKLGISTTHSQGSSHYLSAIATITKGCPSLSCLELYCGRQPLPEGTIVHMNDHPILQRLRIHASSIARRDIVHLLSLTNIKHVIIIAPVDDYLVTLLRDHIPHVEQKP
ncbi:predicted protein [Lichtheimia corymbifera JMRC:FSU:9682]|uniref:Uncharacterized protein n=1 Tax=Lichtheimia corymbifera JMRC:FSU:9682 TaxID=1263082 RepID=A0A068S5V3_9FUNG|nr:predicted protein [Lichtheimia corymbifera JMRC:FSU:9682]